MRVAVKLPHHDPTQQSPESLPCLQQSMSYPSIWQTLVNLILLQSTVQCPHLTDTEATTSPNTD